ncbi:MAG: FHA domain-containing protein [Chloroflexi bacterium]|nr:FHA domain-containing protein [Chloroflexota bacterium]
MTWFIIDSSGYRYPVDTVGLRMGRAAGNDVVLNDDEASRFHALVQTQAEMAWLYDRESSNGVYVNERRISGPHELQSGDVIQVGQTRLQAEYVQTPGLDPDPRSSVASDHRTSSGIWQAALIGAAIGLVGLAVVLMVFVRPLIDDLFVSEVATPAQANIYDDALRSIAFLLTPIENTTHAVAGTGVVLSESGRLLTAYNIAYDPITDRPHNRKSQVLVGLNSSGRYTGAPPDIWYQARVVRADRQRDLAVLQIFAKENGSPLPNSFRLHPATFVPPPTQAGSPVSVISYQGGMGSEQRADSSTVVLGQGSILGFLPDSSLNAERSWIQSDIGLNLQHAGGLALDQAGMLIGLYTGINATSDTGTGSLLRPFEVAQPLLAGTP